MDPAAPPSLPPLPTAPGHDPATRWLSVAGALAALGVLLLHAAAGPRYRTDDPAGDLFSQQLSMLAGLTVASFLTTAPVRRRWVYRLAFPAMAAGVVFPWLQVLARDGSTTYRMLNALAPVGTALLAFGVTWALRTTAADDAARIMAAQAREAARRPGK